MSAVTQSKSAAAFFKCLPVKCTHTHTHTDLHAQRLLILDCMSAAAKELAAPVSAAPQIGEAHPGGAPVLLPPGV